MPAGSPEKERKGKLWRRERSRAEGVCAADGEQVPVNLLGDVRHGRDDGSDICLGIDPGRWFNGRDYHLYPCIFGA